MVSETVLLGAVLLACTGKANSFIHSPDSECNQYVHEYLCMGLRLACSVSSNMSPLLSMSPPPECEPTP